MSKKIYIPARLQNAAVDEEGNRLPVAGAEDIDAGEGKSQKKVNKDVGDTLTLHQQEINALDSQNYVTVTAYSSLPATGAINTIYRVSSYDGTQVDATKYAEYAWNGSAYVLLDVKTQVGEVFDISQYRAVGGTLATFDNLADALDSGNNVPSGLRKGGMSVKFVQSSDNKYVQYRLGTKDWNTNPVFWSFTATYYADGYMSPNDKIKLYSQDVIVTPSGQVQGLPKVISSISTVGGYIRNIKFVSSFNIIGNPYYAINDLNIINPGSIDSNGYNLDNTYCLYFNKKTREIGTGVALSANNFDSIVSNPNNVILILNLYGSLYSPISTLQIELDRLQYPNYRSLLFNTSILCKNGDSNKTLIKSITTGSSNSVTIKFNGSLCITGNSERLSETQINYFVGNIGTDEENGYTLPNVSYLVLNIKSGEIGVVSSNYTVERFVSALRDEHTIVLLYNLWGGLYSPIASLQAELYEYYHPHAPKSIEDKIPFLEYRAKICPSLTIIKQGTSYGGVIKEIVSSPGNLTCTVKFENFIVTGNADSTVNQFSYIGFNTVIDSNEYEIPNVNCLYLDLKNNTINVANIATASSFNAVASNANNIVILYNLWGRLYSPIASLETELYKYYYPEPLPPAVTVITVDASGNGDFTSVRDAVVSITDASVNKPYKIFVKNGTYNEIDIHTKDYVDIEGESKDGVILYTDGTSTANSPSDYNWRTEDFSNIPINTIPKPWKHLFIHMSNSTISNLTMKVRMCKYVIHQDNETQAYEAIVRNCVLIREELFGDNGSSAYDQGLQYIVGIGAKKKQFQRYYNCDFITNTVGLPETLYDGNGSIIWHNWNDSSGAQKAGATFKDCNCFGVKYIAKVFNLKSAGEDDEVIFNNIVADTVNGNSIILETNDYYDEHSVDRMYINVPITNCYKLDSTVLGYGNNMLKQCLNAYSFTKKYTTAALLKGQPVNIENGIAIATAAPFAVVAESVSANEFVYVCTGHTFVGLCVSGTYAIGDEVYINNGKFTKTQTGSAVGKVIEEKTLSADGEVMIEKY